LSPHEKASMASEVYVMQTIRARTTVPVPEVYAWGSGTDNVFGAPFILIQGVSGRNFCNDPHFDTIKDKVLDQMASILIQLSLLRFPAIGSFTISGNISPVIIDDTPVGPFTSAVDYYLHFVSSYEKTAEQTTNENDQNQMLSTSAFYRTTAIPFFIRCSGPFPLTHVDFGLHNLLINDDGDVVSVIDWSNARIAPWESFAIFPLPISVVWTKRAKYPKVKWEKLISEQKVFVEALKKYEKQFCTDSNVSSLIASRSVIAAEGFEALVYDRNQVNRWSIIIKDLVSADSSA
jgi:aminoglycoside phosphotransferase (APT) family kinase protein